MKTLLIILISIILLGLITIRIRILKINKDKIYVYLIITNVLPIKLKIKEIKSTELSNININNIFRHNRDYIIHQNKYKDLIKIFLKSFNGRTIFYSINTYYYLENLTLYLTTFYIYSYLQNYLYQNLNKIKKSCFKSRVKKTNINIEIDIDLETKIYKLLIIFLKNIKKINKILKENKNEQPSNNRIIKNINGKY